MLGTRNTLTVASPTSLLVSGNGLEYPGCSVDTVGPRHLLSRCFRTKGRYKPHLFPLRAQPGLWAVDPVQVLLLKGMQLTSSLRSKGMGQWHRDVPRPAQAWPKQGGKLVSQGEEPAGVTGQGEGHLKDSSGCPGRSPARSHHMVTLSYHCLLTLGCSGEHTRAEGQGNLCSLLLPSFLAASIRQN